MIVAISSGVGTLVLPSHVNLSSSAFSTSKVSMSITRVIFSLYSLLSFDASLCDTKITLLSECSRMLFTSFSELSGRIGIEILPNATVLKNATDQLGMLCERIATLSPAPIPYCVSIFERLSHFDLNSANV